MTTLSEDAKAIVLLCGRLGQGGEEQPLPQRDYARLVRWLIEHGLRPADLLAGDVAARAAAGAGLSADRLARLLGRGVQLGFAIECWNQSGLWVISRSDPDYPLRLKSHLKEKAPPVLYGAGDRALLVGGGLAIVGSRDVDEAGQSFAQEVAAWCARGGVPVVSGGARGVDRIAMGAALEAGGCVIGVLAENLLKKSVARDARPALADSRLLLLSPYHPEARFTVGTAMGRNKLIYAMADCGLVVSTAAGSGGTWAGATEELQREAPRPVYVRVAPGAPAGNRKLLDLGAAPFPAWSPDDDPRALLDARGSPPPRSPESDGNLFEFARKQADPRGEVREAPPATVYDAVLPLLLEALEDATSVDDLARRTDVGKTQVQAWLRRAVQDGAVRKLTGPVRYIRRT